MLDAERALASEMKVGISEKHQVFVEVCLGDGMFGAVRYFVYYQVMYMASQSTAMPFRSVGTDECIPPFRLVLLVLVLIHVLTLFHTKRCRWFRFLEKFPRT